MSKKIQIALNALGGDGWTGGVTYRNNLIKALSITNINYEIFQLISSDSNDDININKITYRKSSSLIDKVFFTFSRRILKKDYELRKVLRKNNIDVIFPSNLSLGKGVGAINWMPDFQFMHLPELYTESQLKSMSKKLHNYFESVSIIILSSHDARKDFKVFSPKFLHKTRVMNFVAHVPENLYELDFNKISIKYNLPKDFIYLPNQFWKHKNHLMVFEALKILKDEGIKPFIVCTGNPSDKRRPLYFAEILETISLLGIREQVIFLGLIPHNDLYSLIRQSKCVLNPSHFEGWSTTVEESKSVGKGMILSDLNVHKEQSPDSSFFFDRYDKEDLAKKIKEVWKNVPPGPDHELENLAREKLPWRMKDFASQFIEIAKESMDASNA